MKTKVAHAQIGWRAPMLLIQVTPLQWCIGACWGGGKYGVSLGPLSIVVYVLFDSPFECDRLVS